MKTELTMIESLKREKSLVLPQDFSESTLLAASHNRNCVKALQKQIPMEAKNITRVFFECPECGCIDATYDIGQVPKHCRNCGQALFQN